MCILAVMEATIVAIVVIGAIVFALESAIARLDPDGHARWAFVPIVTERAALTDARSCATPARWLEER